MSVTLTLEEMNRQEPAAKWLLSRIRFPATMPRDLLHIIIEYGAPALFTPKQAITFEDRGIIQAGVIEAMFDTERLLVYDSFTDRSLWINGDQCFYQYRTPKPPMTVVATCVDRATGKTERILVHDRVRDERLWMNVQASTSFPLLFSNSIGN